MLKLYDAKIQTFYAKVNLMKKAHTRIIKSMLAAMSLMLFAGCTDDAVSTDLLLTSAVELARTGKWQSCEDNAVTVLKRDPANVYAMLLRALAAEQLGKRYGLWTEKMEQQIDMELNVTVDYGESE